MIIYLRPGRYPLAAELHTPFFWIDGVTQRDESYIAGFIDPGAAEKARAYAESHGWKVAA